MPHLPFETELDHVAGEYATGLPNTTFCPVQTALGSPCVVAPQPLFRKIHGAMVKDGGTTLATLVALTEMDTVCGPFVTVCPASPKPAPVFCAQNAPRVSAVRDDHVSPPQAVQLGVVMVASLAAKPAPISVTVASCGMPHMSAEYESAFVLGM